MFIVFLSAILALMNVYLWKRLVKDTTGAGADEADLHPRSHRARVVARRDARRAALRRRDGSGWYAWPGYLWFGLIVYLFLTLLVLEPVRLALRGWVKREPRAATVSAEVGCPICRTNRPPRRR